jgi:sensor histidine kinase regulating citrate/malate metabolism
VDDTTNWILVVIGLVSLVLTIVVPLVAYFNNATNKTRNELSDHKTHVAETYATKHDVKEVGDRMERQMSAGFDNLKELLINHKSRDTA